MDIIVCVTSVPDAASRIEIDSTGLGIKAAFPSILNPFDEIALEEAVRLAEAHGGSVTVVHAGAEGGEEPLRKCLAQGADEAVYVKDPALLGADGLATARVLAKAIQTMPHDVILCGRAATGAAAGSTGPYLAALLGIPIIPSIRKLKILSNGRDAEAECEAQAGGLSVECGLSAVFTATKGLAEPRYPSMQSIMKARKKAIRYLDLNALGIAPASLSTPGIKRERLSRRSNARSCVMLKGGVETQAKEAARFLDEKIGAGGGR
ncbi:MAG: electron transfer flavoprotein subunit beta/FixA family protein [Deltaproteobacteria bacterium]|nr:electron transfer flavoprotein subunit beta/FixA family protein [Deltaproteobacteria bacterium]